MTTRPEPAQHSPLRFTRDQRQGLAVLFTALLTVALAACLWPRLRPSAQGRAPASVAMTDLAADDRLFLVDPNRADWYTLSLVPGLGETLARRIVDYRTQHGPFRSLDDLSAVNGIGPKRLADLRPHLRIAPPSSTTAVP